MGAKLDLTEEKINELLNEINEIKKKPGPLMPALQAAQRIFGCVPVEIQKIISKELDISVAQINGVVTFYAQFSTEPKGKNIVSVCLGTACYVRGSQDILNAISQELGIKAGETSEDGEFTLQATRCIGACGLAPVFTINEHVHGNSTEAKAREAIKALKC